MVWNAHKKQFEMWYTLWNSHEKILGFAHAISSDGHEWKINEGSAGHGHVMRPTPDTWDANGIETNTVVVKNNEYLMWYYGYPGVTPSGEVFAGDGRIQIIGKATSLDGINWTKRPDPVLTPSKDFEKPILRTVTENGRQYTYMAGGVLEPSVLWDDADHMFKMWYAGHAYDDYILSEGGKHRQRQKNLRQIAYTTSKDGIHWEKHGIVFKPIAAYLRKKITKREPHSARYWINRMSPESRKLVASMNAKWEESFAVDHVNVIKDPHQGFHMFYFSWYSIGHAYSDDGIHWRRNPKNPIVRIQKEKNGDILYAMPSAVIKEGKIYLFLGRKGPTQKGWRGIQSYIGLATAPYQ